MLRPMGVTRGMAVLAAAVLLSACQSSEGPRMDSPVAVAAAPAPGASPAAPIEPRYYTATYDDAARYEEHARAVGSCLDRLADQRVNAEYSLPPRLTVLTTSAVEASNLRTCLSPLVGVSMSSSGYAPSS